MPLARAQGHPGHADASTIAVWPPRSVKWTFPPSTARRAIGEVEVVRAAHTGPRSIALHGRRCDLRIRPRRRALTSVSRFADVAGAGRGEPAPVATSASTTRSVTSSSRSRSKAAAVPCAPPPRTRNFMKIADGLPSGRTGSALPTAVPTLAVHARHLARSVSPGAEGGRRVRPTAALRRCRSPRLATARPDMSARSAETSMTLSSSSASNAPGEIVRSPALSGHGISVHPQAAALLRSGNPETGVRVAIPPSSVTSQNRRLPLERDHESRSPRHRRCSAIPFTPCAIASRRRHLSPSGEAHGLGPSSGGHQQDLARRPLVRATSSTESSPDADSSSDQSAGSLRPENSPSRVRFTRPQAGSKGQISLLREVVDGSHRLPSRIVPAGIPRSAQTDFPRELSARSRGCPPP